MFSRMTCLYSAFPPLEVVVRGRNLYSLSNRRLFVFRVCAGLGLLTDVKVCLLSMDNARVRRKKWDYRLGRMASKWERAFSITNDGLTVVVRSAFSHLQTIPTTLGCLSVRHVIPAAAAASAAAAPPAKASFRCKVLVAQFRHFGLAGFEFGRSGSWNFSWVADTPMFYSMIRLLCSAQTGGAVGVGVSPGSRIPLCFTV